MRGTFILFMGVVIGINIPSSKASILCYNCKGVPSARDCSKITRCGNNEECFEEEVATTHGILFNSGCRSKTVCETNRQIQHGKRSNAVACSTCCSTDFCNVGLCTGGTPRGLRCLSCDLTMHPDECDNIEQCDEDQICFTRRVWNQVDYEYRYKTGCAAILQCQAIPNVPQINLCFDCCDKPMCNMYKCGLNWTEIFHTTSQPITIQTTEVSAVHQYHAAISGINSLPYHGNGNLTCTSHVQDAKYTWEFNQTSLQAEHNILYIYNMTEETKGTYTCIVSKDGETAEAKTNLTITEAAAVVHSVRSSPKPAHIGRELNLFCDVTGYPVPEVHWVFTNSQGQHFVPDGVAYPSYGTAHIQSFTQDSHSGTWTCKAVNKLGSSNSSIVIS